MRRIAIVAALVLLGVVLASAADLQVDGGTIQVFTFPVEIELPEPEIEQPEPLSIQPQPDYSSGEKVDYEELVAQDLTGTDVPDGSARDGSN